ncbi:MAG TPA: DUF4440 domain-containing protein [Terriglobales bacterium]|nr:DUF4440 domain-containing protein [Terriglobales bacterium]
MDLRNKVFAVLLLVTLTGCSLAAQNPVRAAIEAQGKEFTVALKRGDAAALAAMYAPDAMAFPPNGEITKGRADIQKLWQGAIDSGMRDLSFVVMEVEKKGDVVYEVGKYSVKGADGKEQDTGKYIVIWKKEKGKWRLYRDIWNSSAPAPATK